MRTTLLLGGLIAAALATAPAASAGTNVGGCPLEGVAKLTPGLTANQPAPTAGGMNWGPAFSYSFHGELADCLDVFAGGYSGGGNGRIYAGEPVTVDGVVYDWPASLGTPTGTGGCTGSHTEGTAIVIWDAGASVIEYTTDGVAAAIGLTGRFQARTLLLESKAKNADGSPVSTRTLNAGTFAGDYAGGPLAFHPADPTLCTSTGVVEAPISGVIGHGNYQ